MHRYRCSEGQLGCGRRFTKARPPHQYARLRCPHCKSVHVRSVERAARAQTRRRRAQGLLCGCHQYPFPHMRGTLRFCEHHTLAGRQFTEREWHGYRRVIDTPRGCYA